jgi:hypothetical protein
MRYAISKDVSADSVHSAVFFMLTRELVMKRHLIALLSGALLSGALLLSGCAALQPSTSVHAIATNQPTFIDMDASRRGVVSCTTAVLNSASALASMFVCEQSINQNLTAEQVTKLYELSITTALKLAEADAAKNQADLARELADPKVREIWQQVFGAPPTVTPKAP